MVTFPFNLCAFCKRTFVEIFSSLGHKHTKPPKKFNHKYNLYAIIIFGNVWTSHLEFFLIYIYLINLKLNLFNFFKNTTSNEKIECMEYICDKIIHVTKFEKIAYILQN